MRTETKARIIGTGSYLPVNVLTNSDLEKMVETSDEWIVSRTGIKERRIANETETNSYMGTEAAKKALEKAGLKADDLDLILVATLSPDYYCPAAACLVQANLGTPNTPAMDIYAACTGFLYALSQAKAFIESGIYKNILVVASEKLTTYIDYQDRTTCILFGDGAGAAVVSATGKGLLIDDVALGCDGSLGELIIIPGGGTKEPPSHETVDARRHYFKMAGNEVFKHAVRRMGAAVKQCIEEAQLQDEKIGWLVPHQANNRIIDAMAKLMNFPEERVFRTIHKYGNTSASSVIIALDELLQEKEIKDGEHILLVAFGGGLTWGAGILTKESDL